MLRRLNKQTGGVEKVEAVMDALKEQMDEVEEVTRVIGEEGAQVDEGEVEEELEEMLRAEEKKQEMADFEARRMEALRSTPDVAKSLEDLTLKDHEEKEGEQQKKNPVPLLAS